MSFVSPQGVRDSFFRPEVHEIICTSCALNVLHSQVASPWDHSRKYYQHHRQCKLRAGVRTFMASSRYMSAALSRLWMPLLES